MCFHCGFERCESCYGLAGLINTMANLRHACTHSYVGSTQRYTQDRSIEHKPVR